MSTTANWLTAEDSVQLAFSLAFEGYDYVATTTSATEMATAWAGTDWTVFKPGLEIVGQLKQSIKPFDPTIEGDSLSFTISDIDDVLIGSVLREANSDVDRTYLTSSLGASGTSASVKKTDDFAASGTIYIGAEAILYDSKSGDPDHSFNALTRGKWSLFGTSSDSTRYGVAHSKNVFATTGVTTAPAVLSEPRTWSGRRVGLYLHHRENGTLATKANALLLYVGRIESYTDLGNGSIRFDTTGIKNALRSTVFANQYTSALRSGIYLSSAVGDIVIEATDTTGTVEYTATAQLANTGTYQTWHDVMDSIQSQLSAWSAAGASEQSTRDTWAISDPGGPTGTRVRFGVHTTSAVSFAKVKFSVWLHPAVWQLLGWGAGAPTITDANDRTVSGQGVLYGGSVSSQNMFLTAPDAPIDYFDVTLSASNWQNQGVIRTENAKGTWIDQPAATIPTSLSGLGVDGFVSVGNAIYAVSNEGTDYFGIHKVLDPVTGGFVDNYDPSLSSTPVGDVRYGSGGTPPTVRQVWIEHVSSVGAMLAKLMLSTGTAAYNEATYDSYTGVGFGLALPYTLVDVQSVLNIDVPTPLEYELKLEGPTEFTKILEPILALTNRYVVFRDGKITIVPAGFENPYAATAASLTEANKTNPGDRTTTDHSADGVINRIEIHYGQNPGGGSRSKIVASDLVSEQDFGVRRGRKIEAGGLIGATVENLADGVISASFAYFGRPLARFSRSFDYSMLDMVPGDLAVVDDDFIVDPRLGTRGVTDLACWVTDTTFDFSARPPSGTVGLTFLPEFDTTRVGMWNASAMVSSYVAATKVLTVQANRFSKSADGVDADFFDASDGVHLYLMDAASPTEYFVTVSSRTGNTITLTTDPTAGAGLAAGTWVLESDDISTAQSSQRQHAYIADDADLTTGLTSNQSPYVYADDSSWLSLAEGTIDYSQKFCIPFSTIDDKGEPMSASKAWLLVDGLNSMLSYKTANVLVNDSYLPSAVTQTGATPKLVYGPIPLYLNTTTRTVKVRVYGQKVGGTTASFAVKLCAYPVTATSATSFTYTGATEGSTLNITSDSTNVWSSETTITPVYLAQGTMWVSWLTVEAYGDTAGVVASLRGIVAAESNL